MFSLLRIIYRKFFVRGKPLHQILMGIVLTLGGGLITWASLFADPNAYYPYFAIFGVVFAIFGLLLLGKGFISLLVGTSLAQPVQGQTAYTNPAQYPQQQPYYAQQPGQQPSYGQPQAAPQPYAQQPGQPPYYGQPQAAPQPYAQQPGQPPYYGQPQAAPQPYIQQPYEQIQYPQQ